jgi:hypothetical protein
MADGILVHWQHFAKWMIVLLFTASCASLGWSQDEPLVIVQKGKYGYIDHTGKIIIRPQIHLGGRFLAWTGNGLRVWPLFVD